MTGQGGSASNPGSGQQPITSSAPPRPVAGVASGSNMRAAVAFAANLSFNHIAKRYGDYTALADISLDIAAGEVVCLLGPSGCGKTTLLRLASGIDRPSAGEVILNGRVVAGPDAFVPPEKRNVGLMFQDFALFPHLTILQNVSFGLRALDKDVAQREAYAALARVGLESYADVYPHVLSGGQQQRVALARAMAPRPSVILMDEPFSGLDVQLRETIRSETLALLRETRSTCLLVTHDPDEAMQLGDRVAVMRNGYVVQAGDAQTLYHNPADLFVARLFSQINEIASTVKGGAIDTPFGRYPAPGHNDGDEVVLCIRQRAVRINTPEDGNSAVAGRVLTAQFLGDLVLLGIGIDGLGQPITSLVRGDRAPSVGDYVQITVDPAGIMIFQE
ncbi:MAG: iron(III) transport system ATP-binding protein [Hyphomicrobiaceae bacterium]|jgi:iron(III) transport system ATP-binding protein